MSNSLWVELDPFNYFKILIRLSLKCHVIKFLRHFSSNLSVFAHILKKVFT